MPFVLLALLLAACGDDVQGAHVAWRFENAADGKQTACPAGFTQVNVYQVEVSPAGDAIGPTAYSIHPCDAGEVVVDLVPALYRLWIEVTSEDGKTRYARSIMSDVDTRGGAAAVTFVILNDGGYVTLRWRMITQMQGTPLDCETQPATIEAIGTDANNPLRTWTKTFPCDASGGTSDPLVAGTYAISVAALGANQETIGTAQPVLGKVVDAPNGVTDLGTVTIPITGL